ncbi:SDR family oxidoreductase [Nonomuraea sp. NPDC049480]|uniref:SDR family oxidoreductase n=1 Tax=Nonomuraea sp. NPDC049480 TaxID=3364353 RepID=UPI003796A610
MTFLVTGATGKAGRHVVQELLRRGHRVRALTRDPAGARLPGQVEVVQGDLTDPGSVRPALRGVLGAHLLTAGGDDYATLRTGPELAAMAAEAGVRRVTLLWNGRPGPVEEAFSHVDVEWTRIEPTDFMSNTLGWAPAIRAHGRVSEPFGDVPIAMIHEADVGAVAAAVLARGGHGGRTYPLTGPETYTPRRRLAMIGKVLGRELEFDELTEEQARERWRRAGYDAELIDLLASWQGNPPPQASTVVPAVREITGREPRTFEQWVRDHIHHFTQ